MRPRETVRVAAVQPGIARLSARVGCHKNKKRLLFLRAGAAADIIAGPVSQRDGSREAAFGSQLFHGRGPYTIYYNM